jgi:anti-sigma factor RsiW
MANHPENDLVPYVRNELPAAERERVERHLRECADCRQDAEGLRELLSRLAATVPAPPPVHWARWRAELSDKLDARRARRRAWWARPMPLALSASLAAGLLVVAVWEGWRTPAPTVEPLTVEEAMVGSRLGLLEDYSVVERLDLLEDIDVIRNLDQLADTREG